MTNEERAKQIIDKYGFDFANIPKNEVIELIQKEIANFQRGVQNISDYYVGIYIALGIFLMFLCWRKQSMASIWMWVA